MTLKTIASNEYEAFLNTYPYQTFLQSSYEGNKMQHDGWSVEYLGYFEKEEMKACCMVSMIPLMKVFKYAYISRGFVADYTNRSLLQSFVSELKQYLASLKVVYLEIDPTIPYQERDMDGNIVEGGFNNFEIVENLKSCGFIHQEMKQGYDPTKQCRWISGIDLKGKTKDEIFSEFSYMTRQDVRTSQKFQVEVRELSYDELHILDEMEQQTSEHQGFEATPLSYYQGLYEFFPGMVKTLYAYMNLNKYGNKIFTELEKLEKSIADTKAFLEKNPNSTKKMKRLKTDEEYYNSLMKKSKNISSLKETYGDEVPLACCLFIEYGKEVVYLVGASNYDCRNFKGPYAVQWTMIQEAIEKGFDFYDFYGISGLFNEGDEGYGVFDYKRGYNAKVVEYIGNFILPVKEKTYKLYKTIK